MSDSVTEQSEQAEETPPTPPMELREGLPPVVETDEALAASAAAIAAGSGPVAIDAERASGYRYSNRAYLIQLRRDGSGTHLIDPIPLSTLAPLADALAGTEWILHAATQDLPCLAEVGLRPDHLFDTELAGRLLGYPRVGLATLVETVLGYSLAKEHSAVDWSTRPLPEPWLMYAALDVEMLVELRAALGEQLEAAGKAEWAAQEFEALRGFAVPERVDPWRRTSGMHRVRGRRGLAYVRALWNLRDEIATDRDVTPGRILPDSAIVAAAMAAPTDRRTLLSTKGFHGRGAKRYAARWVDALTEAAGLSDAELPQRAPRGDGPPPPRAWIDKNPTAAKRLSQARAELTALSERLEVPAENLMTPDTLRRVLWSPPASGSAEDVAAALRALGAREWQVEQVGPIVVAAIAEAAAG